MPVPGGVAILRTSPANGPRTRQKAPRRLDLAFLHRPVPCTAAKAPRKTRNSYHRQVPPENMSVPGGVAILRTSPAHGPRPRQKAPRRLDLAFLHRPVPCRAAEAPRRTRNSYYRHVPPENMPVPGDVAIIKISPANGPRPRQKAPQRLDLPFLCTPVPSNPGETPLRRHPPPATHRGRRRHDDTTTRRQTPPG